MAKLILRSVCVGIASVFVAAFVGGFIALSLLFMNASSDQPSGYDSFFIVIHPVTRIVFVLLAIFAIGFLFGFRYFSKRERLRATPK